jgi:Protein of unknown function (DUF4238)
MPAQKNQHFVPRCALKPFTLNGEGAAINVFNLTRQRAIQNAPTKGQCARDYLYGKDLRAEQKLMELEGQYARIARTLSAGGALPEVDKEWLRLFICIQMQRTEHAIKRLRQWSEHMANAAFRNHPDRKPIDTRTDAHLMRLSMRSGIKAANYATDLKVAILRNLTSVDFVTCDHPAVLTNRFYIQRLNDNRFGMANVGVILLLPLSPRLCAVCYDGAAYSIANASGTPFVDLHRQSDVSALNEFQYLNAGHNIYFSRWHDRDSVALAFTHVAEERSKATPLATVFIRDDAFPGEELYRTATPEEEAASKEEIIATGFQYPKPSFWPSQFRIRSKPTMFSNGSVVGYVRKAEWLVPEAKRSSKFVATPAAR